jgi:hypothetical protein
LAVDSDACVPQDLLHDLLDSLPLQIRFQCSVALLENSRVFSRDSGLSATIETSISRKIVCCYSDNFPRDGLPLATCHDVWRADVHLMGGSVS